MLDGFFDASPFVEVKPRLVHVQHEGDLDLDKIAGDEYTTLLVEIDGNIKENSKLGAWVKKNGSSHSKFEKPPKWDLEEYSGKFVLAEFVNSKKSCPTDIANAIVQRIGTDLGTLAFEVSKVIIVMGDQTKVLPDHVKDTLAPTNSSNVSNLLDSVSRGNLAQTVRNLNRLSECKTDETMHVARVLGMQAVKWYTSLLAFQKDGIEAYNGLGLSKWYFENKLLPAGRRWGETGLKKLIRSMAESERAVLDGAVNPFSLMTASLLQVFPR